jgi:hypothetical protein
MCAPGSSMTVVWRWAASHCAAWYLQWPAALSRLSAPAVTARALVSLRAGRVWARRRGREPSRCRTGPRRCQAAVRAAADRATRKPHRPPRPQEQLHSSARAAPGHSFLHPRLARRVDSADVGYAGRECRFVEDRTAWHVRVAKAQTGEDARGGAGAEHDRRYQVEPAQQGGGSVGLLAGRGRRPARRPGAAGVAPAIVGDDRAGIREDVSDRCPMPRLAGGPETNSTAGPRRFS